MTDWNHKAIVELAGAIQRCAENNGLTAQQRKQLSEVGAAAHKSEWNPDANPGTVFALRAQLCVVCRGEGLYECDQPKGWSSNCRLMAANNGLSADGAGGRRAVSSLVAGVSRKRTRVSELVAVLDQHSAQTTTDEYFISQFSRLQVVLAEFFAREEEVISLIGMPDSEKRQHILEHDRLLGIFHDIYMESMAHKNTMAVEVYLRLRAEVTKHIGDYDARLAAYLSESAP